MNKKLALGCMRLKNLSIEDAEKLIKFALDNGVEHFICRSFFTIKKYN